MSFLLKLLLAFPPRSRDLVTSLPLFGATTPTFVTRSSRLPISKPSSNNAVLAALTDLNKTNAMPLPVLVALSRTTRTASNSVFNSLYSLFLVKISMTSSSETSKGKLPIKTDFVRSYVTPLPSSPFPPFVVWLDFAAKSTLSVCPLNFCMLPFFTARSQSFSRFHTTYAVHPLFDASLMLPLFSVSFFLFPNDPKIFALTGTFASFSSALFFSGTERIRAETTSAFVFFVFFSLLLDDDDDDNNISLKNETNSFAFVFVGTFPTNIVLFSSSCISSSDFSFFFALTLLFLAAAAAPWFCS